jgi:prevent-host-death family protein
VGDYRVLYEILHDEQTIVIHAIGHRQKRDDLSRVLRMAEKEDVIITRHGVPAGILIGFEDPEAWWEELLLRDPRFRARVEQARGSLREGRGTRIEELRKKYGIEPQTEMVSRDEE